MGNMDKGAGMHKSFIALAASVLLAGTAVAGDKTDVMVVLHQWVHAFNQGDMTAMAATCADQASIIDDFPPHVWTGAGACAGWATDFQAFVKSREITDPAVSLGKAWHIDVTADFAYVVAPTIFSFKHKGKAVTENGILTAVLQKGAPGWRMIGWAWADH